MLSHRYCALALLTLLTLAAPSSAQTDPEKKLTDPEPVIEVEQKANADEDIRSRIQNIYSRIDGVKGVEVAVNAGVVTLAGDVSNETLARDAKDIAIRTAGVVTVEDKITRTLDVKGNVTPLIDSAREWVSRLFKAIPLLILAVLVFWAFLAAGGWLSRRRGFWRKIAPNPFLAELISQAVKLMVIGFGAVLALNLLGASKYVTAMLGGAGVVGIAIGFAVRDSMENYISSIMLSLRQPFRAKDHVAINDLEGIVVRLTSRATILMTLDGNHLRIPNSVVFKGIILNYTTNPERRFEFELGVDASDNPIDAMKVGMEALKSHDFVLNEPKPSSYIKTVGDSNIVVGFTGWVSQKDTDFQRARSFAITSVMSVLEDQGFTLPEPIYRLRFDGQLPVAGPVQNAQKGSSGGDDFAAKGPATAPSAAAADVDFDVTPDTHIEEKVNAERTSGGDEDLLDQNRPHE